MGPQIILLGIPGSGKSTQSRRVSEHYNIAHIESGALLRERKDTDTRWGKPKEYIDEGERPPNEMVDELVIKELLRADGFVLDGYPRDESQADIVDSNADIDLAIYLSVGEKNLIARIKNRLQCSDCGEIYNRKFHPPASEDICDVCGGKLNQRKDDEAGKIRKRITEYKTSIAPVLERYKEQNILAEVDGEQEIDAVHQSIKTNVDTAVSTDRT